MSYNSTIAPPPGPTIPTDANVTEVHVNKPFVVKVTGTQDTSVTTAVTLDGSCGVITTQVSTLAALGEEFFLYNNSSIAADSIVMMTVTGYSGTQGFPDVRVNEIVSGKCVVFMQNSNSADALDGALTISFLIV